MNEHTTERAPADDGSKDGLTDDQRVSREDENAGNGARVQPGPADLERDPAVKP